jgi:hypothetical protein
MAGRVTTALGRGQRRVSVAAGNLRRIVLHENPRGEPRYDARMKALSVLVVASLFTFGVAHADIQIRKNGSSWAEITDSGDIRINGSTVGSVGSDGAVRKNGSTVGSVESGGAIRKHGSTVGSIESNGSLRKNGSTIGSIEDNGAIRKNGSSWGEASHCCSDGRARRAVAAVLVFFSDFF